MSYFDSFERFGDKTAFLDDRGQQITYRELAEWTAKTGQHFTKRSLVFCLCESSLGSVVGYLACLNNRMVPLMLDRRIDEHLLAHLLEIYRPSYIYYPADMQVELAAQTDSISQTKTVTQPEPTVRTEIDTQPEAVMQVEPTVRAEIDTQPETVMQLESTAQAKSDTKAEPTAGVKSAMQTKISARTIFHDMSKLQEDFSYILAKTPYSEEEQPPLYEDLALLLTTSGSTGSPKLVRQSYRNIQSNAEAIAAYLELTAEERPVTTLPMNYTYGLSIINSHMQVGATVLLTDRTMLMKSFWDFMKTQKATSFGGVPFTYELLKKVRFFRMELPDLRYMTQAGGKLSPELHREFASWAEERGKKFIVMYGQTEATARMGYLPAAKSIEKYGSMGIPIPGGQFLLTDVHGDEITEPDVVGELIYQGDNVTLGYAEKREDLAKGDEWHGYLVTGDMAKRDRDGYYYIVGRKKRFLKIFGNRVNLDEIDRLIKENFEGIDCASTGVDDRMKTYITDSELKDEVRRYLSAKTHLSESAFEVIYIEEIPKNESGKVLYSELQ